MFKATIFCTAVVMLLSSVALAQDPTVPPGFKYQCQDFTIGALNAVILGGAGGVATSSNMATIIQTQSDEKLCSSALQDELILFCQDATVVGNCGGSWLVGQDALVIGGQLQLVADGCGPKMQTQSLGVGLGQIVTKIDGTGIATGAQNVASVQNQTATNSAGTMSETNIVVAGQAATVSGGPVTSGEAISGLTVGTAQTQIDL